MANSTPPNCGSHIQRPSAAAPQATQQLAARHKTHRQTSEVHERSTTRRRNTCGWHALRPSTRFSFGGAAAVAAGNEGGA